MHCSEQMMARGLGAIMLCAPECDTDRETGEAHQIVCIAHGCSSIELALAHASRFPNVEHCNNHLHSQQLLGRPAPVSYNALLGVSYKSVTVKEVGVEQCAC